MLLVALCLGFGFGAWRTAHAEDAQAVFVVGTCVQLIPDGNVANITRQPVTIAVTAVNGTWVKTKAVSQGNLFNSGAWINTNEFAGAGTVSCPTP